MSFAVQALTANNEGDPSHALTRALIPELRIKKVLYHTMGICETEPAKPPPPPLAPITPSSNFSPILRNAVDHINATVGELLVFAVPDVSTAVKLLNVINLHKFLGYFL